jgi:HK97 family phage major capsid protein
MRNLREILSRQSEIRAELGRLNNEANADGTLGDAAQARWGELETELAGLRAAETRQALLDDADRRSSSGQPIGGTGDQHLERELRSFSLIRAIASQVPGLDVDAGRERELSQEVARRAGRPFAGMAVPLSVFTRPVEERVMTTALPGGGPAGNLIGTDFRPDMFIDLLRSSLAVRRLGARFLNDLRGNVDVPRQKASATAQWVAENSPLSLSDLSFDKVSLTPKHCGAVTEISRNLLLQSSPDIEQLVRSDFAAVLAEALDRAAIAGTGSSNQPRGILSTVGIGSVALGANGAAPTYAAFADLVGAVADVNAEASGSLGFLSNTKIRRAVAKMLATDNRPLGEDTVFQGMPRAFSNVAPSNLSKGTANGTLSAVIYGAWSDLLIGAWSEFDLLVNPYESSAYLKGNIQVRGMMTIDIAVRHPESFAAIVDAIA